MSKIPILTALIGLFCVQVINTYSQHLDIESPLDIPLFLSGNFGELRSTHFHAGIDLKTQGETGKPVFSILKGYVSRFKVQEGGYGHAIYITHENGYTSVYGHLQEYYPELEAYLKSEQYRRKSFELDIYLEKDEFIVSEGMQIGVSGNTGRSGGPHLHFEIRDSRQVPLNVLKFNLPIKDTISPKFKKLVVYNGFDANTYTSTSKNIYPLLGSNRKYKLSQSIPVSNRFTFGVEVYDYLNGSQNKCGVYELELFFDDSLIFSFTIDQISFTETRYIKSHLDYAEKKLNKRNIHKLFREPNNKLSIYNEVLRNGLLSVSDSLPHKALVRATDIYGNESSLAFSVYYDEQLNRTKADSGNVFIPFDKGVLYENDLLAFEVKPYGIYSNKWLNYLLLHSDGKYYSDIHLIGDELVAVNKYPELALKVTESLSSLNPDKLVVAQIDEKGELKSEGGRWDNGFVSAKVSGFGKYVVAVDTVAPEITPLSFKNGGWYAANDIISFNIIDELSGIKTYNGYIDKNWALFEYDAKSDLLFYRIDAKKLTRSKSEHEVEVFVLDERNNLQKFEGFFYY